jgi:hypothetical protein
MEIGQKTFQTSYIMNSQRKKESAMSWFGKLFGTDAAVKGVIESGKELLDDAFYTDSEKAADKAADRSEVRTMLVDWMKNTQGQNLSRRVIALGITTVWLLMFLIATGLSVVSVWVDAETAERVLTSATLIDTRNVSMSGAVMLILSFYFAAPYLGDITKTAMKKFGKQS